jgi:hypothetical protein
MGIDLARRSGVVGSQDHDARQTIWSATSCGRLAHYFTHAHRDHTVVCCYCCAVDQREVDQPRTELHYATRYPVARRLHLLRRLLQNKKFKAFWKKKKKGNRINFLFYFFER